MKEYIPLRMAKNFGETAFIKMKQICIENHLKDAESLTRSKLIESFTDECHASKISEIDDFLFNVFIHFVYRNNAELIKSIDKSSSSIRTEFKDLHLFPLIVNEWSKSKQVFKPDADFAEALLHTEKLCITQNMIDHLPYNLFYVDLHNCKTFSPIVGVFVYVKNYGEFTSFSLYSITEDEAFFSFYATIAYDKNSVADIKMSDFGVADYDTYTPFYDGPKIENTEVSRTAVYGFVLQLISYLSIEEPQLTESDLTKNTYRKPSACSRIRNKWSEVRIQDVGVKYGNAFRKHYQRTEQTENSDKRKSPAPHFRCAHWHKFWVGEGRKTLVVKWIEPVFVGSGDNKNAVIHMVR